MIEPEARRLLTTFDLQGSLIQRVLGTFWTILETRASTPFRADAGALEGDRQSERSAA